VRTYVKELLVVSLILMITTFIWSNNLLNWISIVAVILTFGHIQISDRLMEAQVVKQEKEVECYWKLPYYLWSKEILWVIVFLISNNYSAIVGAGIFLIYPFWRKFHRKNFENGVWLTKEMKEFKRLRELAIKERADWKKQHCACPVCSNKSLIVTLVGPVHIVGEGYRDDINRAECDSCGWRGKVNQLVGDN